MDLSGIGPLHFKTMSIAFDDLASSWDAAELIRNVSSDRVDLVIGNLGFKGLIKLINRRQRADSEASRLSGHRNNVVIVFLDIVLVLNVAHDLLEHILDGDHAGHATIFIHDDGNVIAIHTKVAQHHIEPLGLRHKHCGA